MNLYDNQKILNLAIETYGEAPQKLMLIEEMAELTKEICKNFRGKNNKTEITEEIADVLIMIEQIKIILGITDKDVMQTMNYKIERLEERLNKKFN